MEKRKGEDGLKIWKRKVIGHGVLGILLSFVIVGNATGIYGADIDDTVPVEAESEMTDSGKEEQQEITQEKTQDSDDPEPSAEESQEISHESEEKENPEKDEADKIPETEDGLFYLENSEEEIDTYSFDNSSEQPVANVRYDKFLWPSGGKGSASCPNLGMGMKYIVGDDQNVDGGGKWRYVYCVEYQKDCPIGGLKMQFKGWSNRKVAYALYYGALYYGYPCRYEPYSTGDWQMDYFVTQVAVHILNGEFTLAAARNGMNKSNATTAEKNLAYDRISKIVAAANETSNYGGFTADGWLDMESCTFSLNGYNNSWSLQNGRYLSGGNFHGNFQSYYGYDFREQLTGYEISAPQGVQIEKNGNQTYADFRAAIPQAQYRKWQLTGMQIPITVTASLPRYWGGGIYKSNSASNFQSICLLTWDASGGTTRKQARADLNIEKVTRNLTIYKKDQETQRTLKGALFSLWAYDGNGYSKKIGNFQDMQDGSYQIKNISYTQTKDGWFLIKEERAPENYKKTYQLANSLDEENYRQYGGREIRMNENGFYSDRVEQPCIFYDEKEEPKAKVYVKKYDIKSRKLLTGAQFQIYPWIQEEEKYSDQALQTLSYNSQKQQYETEKEVIADKANQGKFLIRETKLPQHYCGIWQQEITVTEPGTTTLELEAWNYPERKFTIYKKIRTDELVWAHGNPTFFFKISGKDLNGEEHWYQSVILFTKEMEKQQEYIIGKAEIIGIPAGIYQIEELPLTARYILTGVTSEDDNVTVVNTPIGTVNGVQKIRSQVTADLTMEDGSVTFENRKVFFDEYSHDDVEVNHLKVSEEKSSKQ